MASLLSKNPHYGEPSARKLRQREKIWRQWACEMAFLRQIEREIEPRRKKMIDKDNLLERIGV